MTIVNCLKRRVFNDELLPYSMRYKPMLCKLGDKRMIDELMKKDYFFEPKLDGTRAICYVDSNLRLINRRDRNITYRYPEFDFKKCIMAKSCVLDGEIVVYNEKGIPDFHLLQTREQLESRLMIKARAEEMPATYVVFDVLEVDRKRIIEKPLAERKKVLARLIDENKAENIEVIFFTKAGKKLWKELQKKKAEGMVAKNPKSSYQPGVRSWDWVKIKNLKTIDCAIVGYTSEIRRISALVLACWNPSEKGWMYLGRVAAGLSDELINWLYPRFKRLEKKQPVVAYRGSKEIHWIRPEFVAEVKFLELTEDNQLRAPALVRIRLDKKVKDCCCEVV